MQLDQYFVRLTSLALFNRVEKLVQQSLKGDWIVRIQYGEGSSSDSGDTCWHQWKSPFFALKDAHELNQEILACRQCFPIHPIRLHAEKVRPESRFIYWLYTPPVQQASVKQQPEPQRVQPELVTRYPQPQAQY